MIVFRKAVGKGIFRHVNDKCYKMTKYIHTYINEDINLSLSSCNYFVSATLSSDQTQYGSDIFGDPFPFSKIINKMLMGSSFIMGNSVEAASKIPSE